MMHPLRSLVAATLLFVCLPAIGADELPTLPGTLPLEISGDIASQMIDGVDQFLLAELEASIPLRSRFWNRERSSAEAYAASIEPNRQRLALMLGVRDERVSVDSLELVADTRQPALVGRGTNFDVQAVRWRGFGDVHGEGLLLTPTDRAPRACVVAIPDADQTPEQLVGLVAGVPRESQFARHLAEQGCRVVVPTLVSRDMQRRGPPGKPGRANLTNREYVYRSAFELGRHLIGYEVQKVLACVDWCTAQAAESPDRDPSTPPIVVIGYGEGGMLALYCGALDPRIDVTGVSGYFGSRQQVWNEPIDRNVFGLLEQFGDAEIASLVAPRVLVMDRSAGPRVSLPSEGGAPAELQPQSAAAIDAEQQRLVDLVGPLPTAVGGEGERWASERLTVVGGPGDAFCKAEMLKPLLAAAGIAWEDQPDGQVQHLHERFDPQPRQTRQVHELDRHNQWLLRESSYVRADFMSKLDTSSLAAYATSVEPYRKHFRQEVIGSFDQPRLPPNPRSRKAYDAAKWTGYEIVLDVFPNVIAYGILCVPKDIPAGERRPVVVCQHGLEGRPQDVVSGDHRAYHDFAAKLAERGFITFAPQNVYIFRDRFRTLQRKANPLKKTLFSIMVPQHQQIVDWLKTLPNVDGERIAFYGLSYGGKSAMRIPALVTDYALSICSADFNEWVWKNASTRSPYSYVWTGEYEIFEFDLGSTFNYAEMAALICPRPFMVERGHFDGVAPDEKVAHEFAKVRHLYQARLGIGERAEIEWFVGPHTIHGQGTFAFLHRWLDWPEP